MSTIGKHYDLDTDNTLSNNSDITIASQKATKEYIDNNYVPTSRTVNGKALSADITISKSDVSLGNCDNTSDADKPISAATQTALDAKQNTISDLGYIRNQVAKVDGKIGSQDITDSGDSLPPAADYSVNDTFLNKTDKKLYTTLAPAYKLNDDVTPVNITIDLVTGLATGFNASAYSSNYMYRAANNTYNWTGDNSHIYFHFSMGSITDTGSGYMWGVSGSGNYCLYIRYSASEHVFYFNYFRYTGGVWYSYFDYKLFSTQPEVNTEYYIHLAKNGNECIATLSSTGYDVDIIETGTIPTQDVTISSANMMLGSNQGRYGVCKNMAVYLLDTTGKFLIPDGALIWDSGTSLINNTQYNDTTNEKTIYYNNNIVYESGSSNAVIWRRW